MDVFHVFWIVQMVQNRSKHLIRSTTTGFEDKSAKLVKNCGTKADDIKEKVEQLSHIPR